MTTLSRIAASLAITLALAGCTATTPAATTAPAASPGSTVAPANSADVMFTQMMIPHHEQAVTMSDLMLAKQGIAADVTELATRIRNAQQPEIDQMRGWLKAWNQSEGGEHAGHAGMLSQQKLDEIKNADGVAAEKLFLAGMTGHHEGAVAMAKQVQANGSSAEVKGLAAAIISSQTAEIDQMKTMLAARG